MAPLPSNRGSARNLSFWRQANLSVVDAWTCRYRRWGMIPRNHGGKPEGHLRAGSTHHNRMPVILPREAWSAWLGEYPASADALQALLKPYPAKRMRVYSVSSRVN